MKLDGYSLLLPEGTLDYFDVINVVEDSTQIVKRKISFPKSTRIRTLKAKVSMSRW